ncbi:hypothetical protein Tco_0210738 [Tanacetum coccineum]
MWEEFTQSLHNFIEDKRNLAQQAQGKKKATIILIHSIRFTKLIIFHLQRLHNFHPRPESPLHLPTEEPVLGNLKFSAKGTKREVFGMTIPNELINDVIRGADYYDAYLKKRHTPVPSEPAGHEESSSLYAELGLSGSDTESDEEMPSVVRSGAQDEGQAGPDPGKLDEGQAGPNPDDVAESQPLPTPSVLAGPNLEHSDVEITDASSQPQPEHMDEGFIATAYPEVQENLKLTVDEQMIPEEPVSSTGTLSSLQHLTKDFSYGDQFIDDKPSEANYEKTTADTEAESMVPVTIQQDTSVIPPMTSPVIGPVPRPDSPNVHWPLPTTTTTTSSTTTTTLPLPP